MTRAAERAHSGLLLQALYPLGGKVPGLARVPLSLRRATRRALTSAGVRAHLARCRSVDIVAVTGSVGKTTTKDLLAEMLASAGPTMKTRQNDNDLYGVPASLLSIRPDDRFAVIEAGIRVTPGEMAWMAAMFRPHVGVLTGIDEDHSLLYGSREAVAREKRALLERIAPEGTVVVNADDDLARRTVSGLPCRVVLAGRSGDAEVRVVSERLSWPDGLEVELEADGRRLRTRIGVVGRHFAPAVAYALAAARACGIDAEQALATTPGFRPAAGRMEVGPGPNGSMFILDHYKSRVSGALAAIATLGEIPASRRIAVLGEVQDREQVAESYAEIAAALVGTADRVIALGRCGPAFQTLFAGTRLDGLCTPAERVDEAAAILEEELQHGDVVLLHGASSNHLQRVKLILDGSDVRCVVRRCLLRWLCADCPHLASTPPPGVVEAP